MSRSLYHSSLTRNVQYALSDADGTGIAGSDVTEEGTNCCETRVPCSYTVLATLLKMLKEVEHEFAVEIAHLQTSWLASSARGRIENEKP